MDSKSCEDCRNMEICLIRAIQGKAILEMNITPWDSFEVDIFDYIAESCDFYEVASE